MNRNYKLFGGNTNNSCNGSKTTSAFSNFFDPTSFFVNTTQQHPTSSSTTQHTSSSSHSPVPPPTVSLFNLIFYVMCISSVGFSLYANIRQTHYEDRLRHLRHLDDRITILETKIDNFLPFLKYRRNSKSTSSSSSGGGLVSSSSSSTSSLKNKNIFENGIVDVVNDENNSIQQSSSVTDDNDDPLADFTNVANVVRKLSVEVQGIQRLRRDVSHLQLTRRQQRQTAVQSSQECMCPPGNNFK
ncbi:collagen alpha chain CG42342-like [Condylostylus longicornis]|uniref:collagen alpha chain CG42342-like n=1 Tax=Condylostylus longicornis TaxID=2530218 RepID=UPI00244DC926|nr:collagen alpha chain CG42342-like [Condylostylus longicornis]